MLVATIATRIVSVVALMLLTLMLPPRPLQRTYSGFALLSVIAVLVLLRHCCRCRYHATLQ